MVPWSSMNPLSKWVRKSYEREGTRQVKGYVDALDVHLVSSVQSLSRVRLFATPWTTAHQASLFITTSWSPPKPMSIELVMPSNHLILCRPLLLLPFFKKKLYQLLCFEEKEQEQTIYFSLLPYGHDLHSDIFYKASKHPYNWIFYFMKQHFEQQHSCCISYSP